MTGRADPAILALLRDCADPGAYPDLRHLDGRPFTPAEVARVGQVTTTGAGTAEQLAAELDAADDRLSAIWAEYHEWDDQGRGHEKFPRDFWDRVEQANAGRAVAADALWGYFRTPAANAEEIAGFRIWDSRWPYGTLKGEAR